MKVHGLMLMKSWTLGIPQVTLLRISAVLKIEVVLGTFTIESPRFLQL